ncbi:hypothetical protein Tco_1225443 [Tanacetum coccineum]
MDSSIPLRDEEATEPEKVKKTVSTPDFQFSSTNPSTMEYIVGFPCQFSSGYWRSHFCTAISKCKMHAQPA